MLGLGGVEPNLPGAGALDILVDESAVTCAGGCGQSSECDGHFLALHRVHGSIGSFGVDNLRLVLIPVHP